MKHYIDIRICPDPEFNPPLLLNALVSKLHRVLVELKSEDIGISFPGYSISPRTLGEQLRLHSNEQRLSALMESNWLKGMADHVTCSKLLTVPESVHHLVVRRRQFKTNVERLRRRRMKRKGESYGQAVQAIPDTVERKPQLPFLAMNSRSTGELFKLFIEQNEVGEARNGGFNVYGLSQGATVPWF